MAEQIFGKLRDVKLGCFASPATLSLAIEGSGMVQMAVNV